MYTTLKFETPEELGTAIDKYFESCTKDEITQSGLCLHINLGKDALNRYLVKPGYEDIVKMAKLRIENAYETALREKGGAANIFALKNFGWIDRQEHEYSGSATKPLITKIVREVVDVKQIEHASVAKKVTAEVVAAKKVTAEVVAAKKVTAEVVAAKKVTAKKVTAKKVAAKKVTAEMIAAEMIAADHKDNFSVDSDLPSALDDLADDFDDFLQ